MLIFSISRPVAGYSLTPERVTALNRQAHLGGSACEYCGYASPHNNVVFRDGDARHIDDSNLTVADPYCLAWQNLDQINAEAGVMVYLPALAPEDINHLQRTLAQALASDDPAYQQDARALMDWLTSHDKPVRQQWGTAHPQAFATAIQHTPPEARHALTAHWQMLALILNPRQLRGQLAQTPPENATTWWRRFYQDHCSRG